MHRATVRGGVGGLFVSVVKQPEEIESELLWHLVDVDLNPKPGRVSRALRHHRIELSQIIIITLATHRVVSNL